MKLRTSCFKPATLKKDILRFAPVWALYLIGMMLVLLGSGDGEYSRFAKYTLTPMMTAFGVINLGYAVVIAMLLFGDLFNTKMCYSLHAMPYRRESWLMTHLVSGLLFSLVPNVLAALYLLVLLESYWFLAFYWLLAVTLQFMFFFGIATFSAMLTGNRIAMLAVYGVIHFVAMLLYFAVNLLYLPMLDGVVVNTQAFTRFSPVVELFTFDYFQFTRMEIPVNNLQGHISTFFRYDGLADGWGYMAILSILGLVAMGGAFWLYRKRHLECAGDFVAFSKLKGPFCIILTLCVTLGFALVGKVAEMLVPWVFAGLFIGFFGSLMLLERRVKVFRKRTFLGVAVMAVAVAISFIAMEYDWLGIESWTPKLQQVKSVQVTNSSSYDAMENGGYMGYLSADLEDPADIDRIIEAHEDMVDRLDEKGSKYRVTLIYTLRSGRKVIRSYRAPASGTNYEIIRSYLYKSDVILGFSNVWDAAPKITYFYSDQGPVPGAMYARLLDAMMKDVVSGGITPDSYAERYVEYEIRDGDGTIHRFLRITEQAENTLALLNTPELIMGYGTWDELLDGMESLRVQDVPVPVDQWDAVLQALRKDIKAGTIQPAKYDSGACILTYQHRMRNGEYAYREFSISDEAQHLQAWLLEYFYKPAGE